MDVVQFFLPHPSIGPQCSAVPSTDCILQQTKCKLPQTSLCCPTPRWHSHCRFILRLEYHQRFWLVCHIGVALVEQIQCGKIGKTEWKMCKTKQKLGKIFRTSPQVVCHGRHSLIFLSMSQTYHIPHTSSLLSQFQVKRILTLTSPECKDKGIRSLSRPPPYYCWGWDGRLGKVGCFLMPPVGLKIILLV